MKGIEKREWRREERGGASQVSVMSPSPDRDTGPTEGLLRSTGHLRSGRWPGRETRPQQAATSSHDERRQQ